MNSHKHFRIILLAVSVSFFWLLCWRVIQCGLEPMPALTAAGAGILLALICRMRQERDLLKSMIYQVPSPAAAGAAFVQLGAQKVPQNPINGIYHFESDGVLSEEEFDQWAEGYDASVEKSDKNDEYPFAGYKKLINGIYNLAGVKPRRKILDIGFGTGILAKRLYDGGHQVWGMDFSKRMIEIARLKMPEARLIHSDFTNGIPDELDGQKFDCIISTYALHHLNQEAMISFVNGLKDYLNEGGSILIGDVSFETRERYDEVHQRYDNLWDEEETYFVFSEIRERLDYRQAEYRPVSSCAGILRLQA